MILNMPTVILSPWVRKKQVWCPRQDSNLRSRLRRPGACVRCGVPSVLPGPFEGLSGPQRPPSICSSSHEPSHEPGREWPAPLAFALLSHMNPVSSSWWRHGGQPHPAPATGTRHLLAQILTRLRALPATF